MMINGVAANANARRVPDSCLAVAWAAAAQPGDDDQISACAYFKLFKFEIPLTQ
jgi:hypothetical protein